MVFGVIVSNNSVERFDGDTWSDREKTKET